MHIWLLDWVSDVISYAYSLLVSFSFLIIISTSLDVSVFCRSGHTAAVRTSHSFMISVTSSSNLPPVVVVHEIRHVVRTWKKIYIYIWQITVLPAVTSNKIVKTDRIFRSGKSHAYLFDKMDDIILYLQTTNCQAKRDKIQRRIKYAEAKISFQSHNKWMKQVTSNGKQKIMSG